MMMRVRIGRIHSRGVLVAEHRVRHPPLQLVARPRATHRSYSGVPISAGVP